MPHAGIGVLARPYVMMFVISLSRYRRVTVFSCGHCQVTCFGGVVPGSEQLERPPVPLTPWQFEQPKWGTREPGSLGGGAGVNSVPPRATARSWHARWAPACRDG